MLFVTQRRRFLKQRLQKTEVKGERRDHNRATKMATNSRLTYLILVVFAILTWCTCVRGLGAQSCDASSRGFAIQPDAQAVIGGVLALRKAGRDGAGCGALWDRLQPIEAMRWTLERLNQDTGQVGQETITDSYIPGMKLGMIIEDSCSRPQVATRALIDRFPEMMSQEGTCTTNSSVLFLGLLGDFTFEVTDPVARLAGEFHLPVVSFAATSPSLTNMQQYPTFLRTIPSDEHQTKVIAMTLMDLGWTSFALIYSDDLAAAEGKSALLNLAHAYDLCPRIVHKLQASRPDAKYYRDVLDKLYDRGVKIAVYLGSAAGIENLMAEIRNSAGAEEVQWLLGGGVGTSVQWAASVQPYAKGVLVVTPKNRHIAEFENHWVSLDAANPPAGNPLYREWYMTVNKCRFSGVTQDPFVRYPDCRVATETERRQAYLQDQHTEAAILAVYAYAKALKNAHQSLCRGSRGLCRDLSRLSREDFLSDYLLPLDLTFYSGERIPTLASNLIDPYKTAERLHFDENGDVMDVMYDVWNYNDVSGSFGFTKVGSYYEGLLALDKDQIRMYDGDRRLLLDTLPQPFCPPGALCGNCVFDHSAAAGAGEARFAYAPGNVLLGAAFSVHRAGGGRGNGFSCGTIDTHQGAQLLQAFLYALEQVKAYGVLPVGVTLGAAAFDDCASPEKSANDAGNLFRGLNGFGDVPINDLRMFLGGQTDAIAVALNDMLSSLNVPLLSYGSTTESLQNGDANSLFAATQPSVRSQLEAVVLILKKMGWSYFQEVHASDEYGEEASNLLRKMAAQAKLCTAASNAYDVDISAIDLIEKLRESPNAKVVVVNGEDWLYSAILEAINSTGVAGEFTILGTVQQVGGGAGGAGGRSAHPLMADGTLTLAYANDVSATFLSHLRGLDPRTPTASSSGGNPWFSEWYQEIFDCYLGDSNPYYRPRPCAPGVPITEAPDFRYNRNSVFVVNGVYAAARALHTTLTTLCGDGYQTLCRQFYEHPSVATALMKNLLEVSFTDESQRVFSFSFTGREADRPIEVLNVQNGAYVKVGEYRPVEDALTLHTNNIRHFNNTPVTSECTEHCVECLYLDAIGPESHMSIPGDYVIAGLLNIHEEGPLGFLCGDMKTTQSVQFAEAFKFAVTQVNAGEAPVALNGVTLGALILDACSSPVRAAWISSNVHSGSLKLATTTANNSPGDNSGNSIIAWLTSGSDVTYESGGILSSLNIAQVGLDVESSVLNMDGRLQTWFNTISTRDKLAKAAMAFLSENDWKNFQIVVEDDGNGKDTQQAIENAAREEGLCVTNSLSYASETPADDARLIANIVAAPTDVVLVMLDSSKVEKLLKAHQQVSAGLLFIVVKDLRDSLESLARIAEAQRDNVIIIDTNVPSLPDFDEFLAGQRAKDNPDPWFSDYYQILFQCNLGNNFEYPNQCFNPDNKPVTEAASYKQDSLVASVTNGVYAITQALHLVLSKSCGDGYSGLCDAASDVIEVREQVVEKLAEVDFLASPNKTFSFDASRQYNTGYSFYTVQPGGEHSKVAEYEGDSLSQLKPNMLTWAPTSSCGSLCSRCQQQTRSPEDFSYIPGDVILAGIFDVHDAGNTLFSCGGLNTRHGIQLLEAFNYAIEYVNEKRGIFADKLLELTLGGVALDACRSPVRAASLVANIQSGTLNLGPSADRLDVALIDAYVGAFDSDTSAEVSDVLGELGIPQVSYGSSSTQFGAAGGKSPWLLRTVPSDEKEARAIVALLKKFDLTYVQVVHSVGVYGESTSSAFVDRAASGGICVAQTLSLDDESTYGAADEVVKRLLQKSSARVVVLFLDTDRIRPFLQAVSAHVEAKSSTGFKFVGSESWADNLAILEGLDDVISNVFTLGVETADVTDFDRYLDTQRPGASSTRNPWFDDYYQEIFQCSLKPTTSSRYSDVCDENHIGVVRSRRYSQDPYVLYTVNAVFSVALGIQKAIENVCSEGEGMCPEFANSNQRRKLILQGIREVQFNDATGRTFEFTPTGSSNRGFHIYNVRSLSGKYLYENVGSYNDTHQLKLDAKLDIQWQSKCSTEGACPECPLLRQSASQYAQMTAPGGNVNLVSFFPIHQRDPENALRCGAMDSQNGMQSALAFFYAMDRVNKGDFSMPAGLQLSGVVFDTCGSPMRVIQNAYGVIGGGGLCPLDADVTGGPIHALLALRSDDVMALTDVARESNHLVLGSGALSAALDGKPNLLRTVPSPQEQANIMAEVAREMEWMYLSSVYTDDTDGKAGVDIFTKASGKTNSTDGVCISRSFKMSPSSSLVDAKDIIRQIREVNGVRVIVLFTARQQTRMLLQAVKDLGLTGKFIFLSSARWADSDTLMSSDFLQVARGSITLQFQQQASSGFSAFVERLTVAHHPDIPDDWFEEFWQVTLKCRLENATAAAVQRQYTRICAENDRITAAHLAQGPFLLPTIIATQAVALGLKRLYHKECQDPTVTPAACLKSIKNLNQLLVDETRLIRWSARQGMLEEGKIFQFQFNKDGYGNQQMSVLNLLNSGTYKQIGYYDKDARSLVLDTKNYERYESSGKMKDRILSHCALGQTCKCILGTGGTAGDSLTEATAASEDRRVDIHANLRQTWGIVLAVLTAVGIVITLVMFVYFLIYYPMKGGTSILGYMMMFSVLLIYAVNYAFLLQPDAIICNVRKFCLGYVYALCFSSMLVKILVNWQVQKQFEESYIGPSFHRLLRPISIFCITIGLSCVQAIIAAEWMILVPTHIEWVSYEGDYISRCAPSDFHNEELIISCVFVMFLILLTLVFSVVTWDSKENTRESRWILACTCFVIGVWIVWPIITILTEFKYRDPCIVVANLVNATLILFSMFVRKMYLWNKFQKEEEEDRKSRLSYVPDDQTIDSFGNLYVNQAFDDGTSSRKGTASRNGSGILYPTYDPNSQGADVQY